MQLIRIVLAWVLPLSAVWGMKYMVVEGILNQPTLRTEKVQDVLGVVLAVSAGLSVIWIQQSLYRTIVQTLVRDPYRLEGILWAAAALLVTPIGLGLGSFLVSKFGREPSQFDVSNPLLAVLAMLAAISPGLISFLRLGQLTILRESRIVVGMSIADGIWFRGKYFTQYQNFLEPNLLLGHGLPQVKN